MATITTTMALQDDMTPKLRNMNSALSSTTNRLLGVSSAMNIARRSIQLFKEAASAVDDLTEAYKDQYESEVRLWTIMRQRMSVTKTEFESMRQLSKEIESYGILSDKVILAGAQQIATYVDTEDQIRKLLPALANLTAQQYGYNASAEQMKAVASTVGKMLNGTISGLNNVNLGFSEAEKKVLKLLDMETNVNLVAGKINQRVGQMNEALAKTNTGSIQSLNNQIQGVNEQMGRLLEPLKRVALQIKLSFQTKALELLNRTLAWVNKNAEVVSIGLTYLAGVITVVLGRALAMTITKLTAILGLQSVLNWHITLIVAGIMAVVAVLNRLGISVGDIFGVVSGVISAVMALLNDVVAFVMNAFVRPIYNTVAWLVEMIGNLLQGNLVGFVKQAVSSIVELLLAPVKLVATLVDGISSLFGNTKNSATNWVDGIVKDVNDWAGKDSTYKVERMDWVKYENPIDSFMDSYNKSSQNYNQLAEYIRSATSGFETYLPDVNVVDGAMSVYDKNLIDIAEDYRDLLSKRAVEKFNLQFSRVSPSVTIENVSISHEADAEKVLNTLTKALDDYNNSTLSGGGLGGGRSYAW